MSNSSHFQPWIAASRDVRGTFYGKVDNDSAAAGAASSMSLDLYTQIGLQKVAALYKASRDAEDAAAWTEADEEKTRKMQQFVEATIGDCAKEQIFQLVEKISQLKPPERLFLYLRMPGGNSETDPLRQPQNPLGTRSEITHTINWVRSHLEHDPAVSIPKQDVYDDYIEYCTRSTIKPLSTADFGKVMKQVFPNVRPRRLGTRGHSRYCYSAMRKATKLSPPVLPELGGSTKMVVEECEATDGEAWRVVKGWAESLLSTSFDTLKDLASHINSHGLHLPANTASRILLQKKLLQRDGKDKKKCTDADGSSMKKRRKRRRKNSASSTESIGAAPFSDTDNNNGNCQESRQIEVKSMRNNSNSSCSQDMKPFVCEDLPFGKEEPFTGHQEPNLSIQGTNSSCDSGPFCQAIETVCVKQEVDVAEHQNIFCKKVRQAQQAKGLWPLQSGSAAEGTNLPPNGTSDDLKDGHCFSQPQLPQNAIKYERRMMQRDGINTFKRIKLPGYSEDMPENGSEIPGDFILPRERVISICNMDKDALDDYLNGGDNSQEPEAELMQYFSGEMEAPSGKSGECESADLGQLQTSIPLLENYQLFSDGKGEGSSNQINQLRQYLQQSLQTSGKNSSDSPVGNSLNLYPGSASASLAMMSQRLMSTDVPGGSSREAVNLGRNAVRKKLNIATATTEATNSVPHSPNTRRRNFSFVPISAGPQSPQIRTSSTTSCRQTQTFVSPRVTPVTRRSFRGHCSTMMAPVKTEAASAPPSPPSWTGKSGGYVMKQPVSQGQVPPVPEMRSQSVPLHCRSPLFGGTINCSAYTSACSSVAQTPIPPDYTDFTSDVGLLDYFNGPVASSSAAAGIVTPVLDGELNISDFPGNSRSVPSTPLPINGTTVQGTVASQPTSYAKMYDMSKSMPSTPLTGGNLFRYSPEINRDFLINGNSLDASKQPPFYGQPAAVTSAMPMDATMGDKEFSTFTDSIISNLNDGPTFESELLDNL